MALDSVSSVSTGSSNSHINQQDFLRILLTQLNAQDPLKPMDNTAFVAQLAQFSQLEQSQQMLGSMNQLVAVQTASQTVALLGKTVDVTGSFGGTTTGVVTNMSVSGTTPVLTVHPSTGSDLTGVARKQISNIR
jgi:flagellar basal-body rod modification protein FlgD